MDLENLIEAIARLGDVFKIELEIDDNIPENIIHSI